MPQPGYYPPAPGFNNQPIYPNYQPQPQPMYPYPGQAPPPPEFNPPPAYNPDYPPVTHAPGPGIKKNFFIQFLTAKICDLIIKLINFPFFSCYSNKTCDFWSRFSAINLPSLQRRHFNKS